VGASSSASVSADPCSAFANIKQVVPRHDYAMRVGLCGLRTKTLSTKTSPWRSFVPYVANHWIARKHRGVWRFRHVGIATVTELLLEGTVEEASFGVIMRCDKDSLCWRAEDFVLLQRKRGVAEVPVSKR
jgi:hypothetical protein